MSDAVRLDTRPIDTAIHKAALVFMPQLFFEYVNLQDSNFLFFSTLNSKTSTTLCPRCTSPDVTHLFHTPYIFVSTFQDGHTFN